MDQHLILWPLLAQILLTLLMYLKLAIVKKREFDAGNVDLKRTALDQSAWPESVIKINNNLRNQFETPILFYILCMLLWALGGVSVATLIVAALYVVARYAHAFIHTSSNIVPYRFLMFMVSMVMLFGLFGISVRAVASL